VIDHDPYTPALRDLIDYGIGLGGEKGDAVTEICTAKTSTTAVLLVLLTEMIALELQPSFEEASFALPADLDGRLARLVFAGPPMARWSFLLNSEGDDAFYQQVNAAMAEDLAYVPLRHNAKAIVRAFAIREEIRGLLGLGGSESAESLCGTDGFLVRGGRAYMPLGLDLHKVVSAHRTGALSQAKDALPWPEGVSSVLVCRDGGAFRGVSLETGHEVPIP
jgi:hypothetical protein